MARRDSQEKAPCPDWWAGTEYQAASFDAITSKDWSGPREIRRKPEAREEGGSGVEKSWSGIIRDREGPMREGGRGRGVRAQYGAGGGVTYTIFLLTVACRGGKAQLRGGPPQKRGERGGTLSQFSRGGALIFYHRQFSSRWSLMKGRVSEVKKVHLFPFPVL